MKCLSLSAAGLLVTALQVSAAAAQSNPAGAKETNFLEILARGGIMMYPLGLMSFITVVLVIVFLLTIRRNAVVSGRYMKMTETMIRKEDYLGLIDYSHRRNECMARVTQKTLEFLTTNPRAAFESVRDVAQVEGSHQASTLTSRITYLADIGAIAPMVGLLGTVLGMIEAFIQIYSGQVQGVREMGLAEGVSKALIATAGGLAISIPALSFYSFFRGRVQAYVAELEAAATHLIALLHLQYERHPAQHPQQTAPHLRPREDYVMPPPGPLIGEQRPDLHGI